MRYHLFQDGGEYGDGYETIQEATDLAEVLLGGCTEPTTFTVENNDGYVVASLSNRQITGVFTKQVWAGRKQDYAETVDTVEFDATSYILLMEYNDLVELVDHRDTTDMVGEAHVSWDGPFEVDVVESICEYFGVNDITDITEEMFAFVKQHVHPKPYEEKVVTLTVKLKVYAQAGADLDSILHDMDYKFVSATPGAVITSSEIVDQVVA